LPGPDQIGRPLRPRCRDYQKQHDRIRLAPASDGNAVPKGKQFVSLSGSHEGVRALTAKLM
jgi:hypothetical protein